MMPTRLLLLMSLWFFTEVTTSPIELQAMGRFAYIGELFNATAGNFTGGMVFKKALPPQLKLIRENDNPFTETTYAVYDSFQQKTSFLKVGAEVAIEVKTGSVEVGLKGKAAFIRDEKSSRKYVEGVFVHNTLTKKESIQLTDEEVRGFVSTDILLNTDATHVVTGIYYGADVYIKFVDSNVLNEDKQEISGSLDMTLKLTQLSGTAHGELNMTDSEINQAFNYSLEVFGDVPIHSIPATALEVQELIKTIPKELEKINEGKGIPLRYVLTPVSELRKAFELDGAMDKIIHDLDEDKLNRIMVTLDEISEVRQMLNDLAGKLDDHSEIVPPPERKRLRNLTAQFDSNALNFQADIREALIYVRSTGNQSRLTSIQGSYILNEFSPESVRGKLQYEFEETERKIPFYNNFRARGLDYLGKSNSLGPYLIHAQSSLVYIVYFSIGLVEANVGIWEENRELLGYIDKTWSTIAVLDCDFWKARCENLNHTVIQGYFKGRLGTTDARLDMPKRDESIKILPAIGETKAIGDLYDATTGRFVDESIFLTSRSQDKISSAPSKSLGGCTSVETFGWEGILSELQAPAELGFLIYSKNILLVGSGEVFIEAYNFPASHTASLVCFNKTQVDSLNITADSVLFNLLDMAAITASTATHFVEKIEFGATTFVTFNNSDPAQAKVDADRWKPTVERNLTRKPNRDDSGPGNTSSLVKLFSDISPRFIHELSLQDLTEFLKAGPETGKRLNDGIGVPVFYTLRPISVLKTNFAVASQSVSVLPEDEKLKREMVANCGKADEPLTCITQRFGLFNRAKEDSNGYIHNFDTLSQAFGETETATVFLFLFKYQWVSVNNTDWTDNEEYFFKELKTETKFIVDCNFFEDQQNSICQDVLGPVIFKYEFGTLVSEDYARNHTDASTDAYKKRDAGEGTEQLLMEYTSVIDSQFGEFCKSVDETSKLAEEVKNASGYLGVKMMSLSSNPPPLGFVYVQPSTGEASPERFWSGTYWQDISMAHREVQGKIWKRFM